MTVGAPDDVAQARVLVATGRRAEAIAALDALLAQDPSHAGALLLKADLLLETRDGEDALVLYRRAVAAEPALAAAHEGLARCLHALARDPEAIVAGLEARRLLADPANFRAAGAVYLTLVWCLRETRQFKEALAMAEEGLARTSDAVLAQWASLVEEELADSQKEGC
jgi:tetratricopeptide (TPR) repeat protein